MGDVSDENADNISLDTFYDVPSNITPEDPPFPTVPASEGADEDDHTMQIAVGPLPESSQAQKISHIPTWLERLCTNILTMPLCTGARGFLTFGLEHNVDKRSGMPILRPLDNYRRRCSLNMEWLS